MHLSRIGLATSVGIGLLALASAAEAAPLNSRACRPSGGKFPVVVVHGRGGNFNDLRAITDTLINTGYCVFATNHGFSNGANGLDHLDVSGRQIRDFVDGVLRDTGAAKVNLVGHSAGVGVINNVIQLQGRANKVHRVVSFGGLHHPYAHAGVAKVADADLFLPNTIAAVRLVVPNVNTKDIVRTALDVYKIAGGSLAGINPNDINLVTSNFVSDLFDPSYWQRIHGGMSEAPGTFVKIGASTRSIKTNDSAPNVCYTNIVGVADLITGATAGFQDDASNVENWVLPTLADHSQMTGDALALGKMVAGLGAPCTPRAANANGVNGGAQFTADEGGAANGVDVNGEGEGPGLGDVEDDALVNDASGGCTVTPRGASPAAGWLGLAIGAFAWLRRRRSACNVAPRV